MVERNEEGFLIHDQDWDESIAAMIAREESIVLTELHWQLIHFIRHFYQQTQTIPVTRALIKAINEKHGINTLNSVKLALMFPKSPTRQLSKIAGLPKPVRCI